MGSGEGSSRCPALSQCPRRRIHYRRARGADVKVSMTLGGQEASSDHGEEGHGLFIHYVNLPFHMFFLHFFFFLTSGFKVSEFITDASPLQASHSDWSPRPRHFFFFLLCPLSDVTSLQDTAPFVPELPRR